MRFTKELYPRVALIKSAYSFTDRAYVHLDANETHYIVEIMAKPGCDDIDEQEFVNEMLAQCVRHEVYLQTKNLRELLVARAMASTVIELPDQDIAEDLTARNFEPSPKESEMAAQILTDWFESNENPGTEQ